MPKIHDRKILNLIISYQNSVFHRKQIPVSTTKLSNYTLNKSKIVLLLKFPKICVLNSWLFWTQIFDLLGLTWYFIKKNCEHFSFTFILGNNIILSKIHIHGSDRRWFHQEIFWNHLLTKFSFLALRIMKHRLSICFVERIIPISRSKVWSKFTRQDDRQSYTLYCVYYF
jgi:hypothetical protein